MAAAAASVMAVASAGGISGIIVSLNDIFAAAAASAMKAGVS